jgi:superfamily II DNA or RNA helicase
MSDFETREYQDRAAAWLAVRKRGIVQAPAGSGKSRLLAMALNNVITKVQRTKPVKIGWIAPTIETRNQGNDAMNQFPAVAAQDIKIACAAADEDWSDRDVLIVDECHHSGSPMNKKQI